VIVESAPTDKKRLAPNVAKAIDPAMKAKKPICGENCQIASNRDPLFAFNRDPSEALGLGLSM